MTFQGFPDEALIFYEGLEADNSKAYWQQHRETYESCVRAPLLALLAEIAPEFGTPTVFRPYRDLRFAADKTPYKTHQGAVVRDDAGRLGAWYLQLSADGLMVSGGVWRMESDQVERYRRAVADDVQGPRLATETGRLTAAQYTLEGHRLARTPAGYAADAPRVELLRHRALHATRRWEPADWLHDRRALNAVQGAWRELRALNDWLADNVGPTTKELRRR